jgi:hypothetical protein
MKAANAIIACYRSVLPENEEPADTAGSSSNSANFQKSGAGEGIRTLDPDLGKVVLYH